MIEVGGAAVAHNVEQNALDRLFRLASSGDGPRAIASGNPNVTESEAAHFYALLLGSFEVWEALGGKYRAYYEILAAMGRTPAEMRRAVLGASSSLESVAAPNTVAAELALSNAAFHAVSQTAAARERLLASLARSPQCRELLTAYDRRAAELERAARGCSWSKMHAESELALHAKVCAALLEKTKNGSDCCDGRKAELRFGTTPSRKTALFDKSADSSNSWNAKPNSPQNAHEKRISPSKSVARRLAFNSQIPINISAKAPPIQRTIVSEVKALPPNALLSPAAPQRSPSPQRDEPKRLRTASSTASRSGRRRESARPPSAALRSSSRGEAPIGGGMRFLSQMYREIEYNLNRRQLRFAYYGSEYTN